MEVPGRGGGVWGGGAGRVPALVAAPSPPARKDTTRALIAGAGPAGDAVAAGLRDAGFAGEIVLVGAEPELPYERPHLSKGYLLGTVLRERLPPRPPGQLPRRRRGVRPRGRRRPGSGAAASASTRRSLSLWFACWVRSLAATWRTFTACAA